MYSYQTEGVCSRRINMEVVDDIITHVDFEGGCNGNLKAISKLIVGMTVDEVANAFEGMTCGARHTSCADQLVKGLREAQDSAQSS